jgi:hypothetical protein
MCDTPAPAQLTLESLAAETRRLQARVEDLEDIDDLDEPITDNAGAPGVAREEVKMEFLED